MEKSEGGGGEGIQRGEAGAGDREGGTTLRRARANTWEKLAREASFVVA